MVRCFIFGTIHSLSWPRDIGIDQLCYNQSSLRYFKLLQQCTLYFCKVTVTPKNIEDGLIMSQQSLTQFFKSTSNKRKPEGTDSDHETTVTKNALTFKFARVHTEVFSRLGLLLESVGLAKTHLQIASG